MFWVRLRSGIILMVIAVFLLVMGGAVMNIGLLAVSLVGMYELYKVIDHERTPLAGIGYLAAVLWFLTFLAEGTDYAVGADMIREAIPVIMLLFMLVFYVFSYPDIHISEIVFSFFVFFYVPVMISYMLRIRGMENGQFLVWLVFISSWGCDTCAYCAGMLFGKHKMAPVLSPKKSVEGAVGGVIGAALIGLIFALVFRNHLTVFIMPVPALMIIGAVGALISMVGDLAASAIKRQYNIKDYGTLIPGHGGIMDRVDSVIITAPLIWYLICIIR